MSSAYEIDLLQKQVETLEKALNEARAKAGLPEVQLPRSAYKGR